MAAAGMDATPGPGAGDLDLRALTALEPMLQVLAATDTLGTGETLVLWTPALPLPLLHMLAARDMESAVQMLPDGTARVTVRHSRTNKRHKRR